MVIWTYTAPVPPPVPTKPTPPPPLGGGSGVPPSDGGGAFFTVLMSTPTQTPTPTATPALIPTLAPTPEPVAGSTGFVGGSGSGFSLAIDVPLEAFAVASIELVPALIDGGLRRPPTAG